MDVQNKEVDELFEKELSPNCEVIEKTASINWDGKNFLIRIPKEIAWASGLKEDNIFKKEIKFKIIIDKQNKISSTFEVINRSKPKREVRSGKTNKKQ